MKLSEAYAALDLDQSVSKDEAKKRFRELSKKWHPDINKEEGAEQHFKKINQAYQCIQNGHGDEPGQSFSQRQYYQHVVPVSIQARVSISFKEAVLGCKREISFARQSKCQLCGGQGEVKQNNGCKKCGGSGQMTSQQRGMVFVSSCSECKGRANIINCSACNGQGTVETDVSVHVSVPAGLANGNILRLQGMGNYAGSVMGLMDHYTDVFCHVDVQPEPGLSIEGNQVVSILPLSLIDALKGCQRTVKTIQGIKMIEIKPMSRHKDEVLLPKMGVAGAGDQKIILDVSYPEDLARLVDMLSISDRSVG